MYSLDVWKKSLADAQQALESFLSNSSMLERCDRFSTMLYECFEKDRNLLICGNGGSHCDAMHFAEELTGRFRKDRRPLGAIALGDASHMSCVANDFGFDQVFARQVEGLGKAGDLFVGISTSGNSKNVILAAEAAKRKSLLTVGLLGRDGGKLKDLVDLAILVPGESTDRIQELHIKIIHIVMEAAERKLFPQNYR